MGMTLSTLVTPAPAPSDDAVTFFGSMLFSRCVSGTRTVPRGKRLEVGGIEFEGYGAHHDWCVWRLWQRLAHTSDRNRCVQLPASVSHRGGGARHHARRYRRLLQQTAQVLCRRAQASAEGISCEASLNMRRAHDGYWNGLSPAVSSDDARIRPGSPRRRARSYYVVQPLNRKPTFRPVPLRLVPCVKGLTW